MQGKVNYVYSGLSVILKKDGKTIKKSDFTKSKVYMKPMIDEEILDYIKTKEPMDKAGSYAVQGIGSKFIEKIEGSYDSVVGLDIEKLEKMILETVTFFDKWQNVNILNLIRVEMCEVWLLGLGYARFILVSHIPHLIDNNFSFLKY